MVLLKNLLTDEEGRYIGETEIGEIIRITGIPSAESVGVFGRDKVESELEKLKKRARKDYENYYLLPDLNRALENRSSHSLIYSIPYTTFEV